MELRKVVLLLLMVVLLIGCSGKEADANKVEEMDRAVFAWEGVDEEGLEIIKKYGINTILSMNSSKIVYCLC